MDADFIAVKDMDPILALLETHDFISYQMEGVLGDVGMKGVSALVFGCVNKDLRMAATIACTTRFLNRAKSQTCRRFIEV